MSGLSGVSMLFPERIAPNLLHISTNFQATSAPERAFDILDAGGVLSIKAHITKNVPGHTHLDGVDDLYMNYLDRLFDDIEQRYGDAVEWTTLGRLATSSHCQTKLGGGFAAWPLSAAAARCQAWFEQGLGRRPSDPAPLQPRKVCKTS